MIDHRHISCIIGGRSIYIIYSKSTRKFVEQTAGKPRLDPAMRVVCVLL